MHETSSHLVYSEGVIFIENFGKEMKKMRLEKGMKQEELAFLLNVKKSTISNWEVGVRKPSLENYFKLCKILGIKG